MTSYIDPAIVPRTVREAAVLAEVARRRLSAHKLHAEGEALRITGPGVFVLAASLAAVQPIDLEPALAGRR